MSSNPSGFNVLVLAHKSPMPLQLRDTKSFSLRRSFEDGVGEDGYLRLKLDLVNTEAVERAFAKVIKKFGIPSVVVYNGKSSCDSSPDIVSYIYIEHNSQVRLELRGKHKIPLTRFLWRT
jgi:hypothetical protein